LKTVAKKTKLSTLKTKLWDLVALHQKLSFSADGIWCNCYTCDKPIKIGTTDCQAGHAIPKGGYTGIYFTEECIRPQCYRCNHVMEGNHAIFEERLKRELGENIIDQLKMVGRHPLPYKRADYLYLIDDYTEKVKQLKKEKGL